MKENQQISQIKQIVSRFSLCNSVCLLFLIIACLIPWQVILAHGGGELQISNAPIGDYLVSVWSNPPTAQAGQAIHVTVGVARAATGEPVLDTAVTVTILNENSQPVTTAAATTEQSVNRLFYEADLDGVPAGAYEMQIEVAGNDGSGQLAFPLAVQPPSYWPWLAGAAVAMIVIWFGVRYWRKGGMVRGDTAVPRRRPVD